MATPSISATHSFNHNATVILACSTSGATFEYQVVALYAAPGGSWTTYTTGFLVVRPCTVYARATKVAMTPPPSPPGRSNCR